MPLLTAAALAASFAASFGGGGAARADALADTVQLCGGCHGESGVPLDSTVPVIWGQQQGYLYVELRDYKLGNRKNETMQAIAADLSKDDMMALAEHFAGLAWPNLGQNAPDAATLRQARAAESSAVCTSCHMEQYQGASTAPRLAGQGADYLRSTMLAFRSGARANNSWMTDLLKTYSEADAAALAAYLAGM